MTADEGAFVPYVTCDWAGPRVTVRVVDAHSEHQFDISPDAAERLCRRMEWAIAGARGFLAQHAAGKVGDSDAGAAVTT